MDIKAKIDEIVDKIKGDKKVAEKFEKNPVAVIEDFIGIDLPDEQIMKIVDGVKAKIKLDNIGDAVNMLGGLFGKK